MQKQKISFELEVYESLGELRKEDRQLIESAIRARQNAYAPYSDFKVGAAVLLANGKVVTGNNQENASYPSGLCAERVAVFHAGALYPGVAFKTIAICAAPGNDTVSQPAAPCGNCRQAISEYEQKQLQGIRILMKGSTDTVFGCSSVADLLPLPFGFSYLK